jgi:hypothetical protein
MNKSYRSIWNEALGAWVAASEITSARGKRSKSKVAAAVALVVAAGFSPTAGASYVAGGAQPLFLRRASQLAPWASGSAARQPKSN